MFSVLCVYVIMCILPVTLGHWFSTGDDFAPRKHWTVSRDILVVTMGVGVRGAPGIWWVMAWDAAKYPLRHKA